MLIKVLKENVTLDFRNFGEITVPIGTKVNHQTALGEDPTYNFVCEFDWTDEKYPEISNILKQDAESYGLNIPKDKLTSALWVKFLYDDSGNCKDIFKDFYSNKKYCRMEV